MPPVELSYDILQTDATAAIVAVVSTLVAVAGWRRGVEAPARRKLEGKPSVDAGCLISHDIFNLVVLPLLMVINVGCWFDKFDPTMYTHIFTSYIAIDLCWIWVFPYSVPQPSLVLAHHGFVLALLSHPVRYPANAHFTANVAVVEINTIIMVGRRHFARWLAVDDACRRIIQAVTSFIYWTTYFGIRFVVHPCERSARPLCHSNAHSLPCACW